MLDAASFGVGLNSALLYESGWHKNTSRGKVGDCEVGISFKDLKRVMRCIEFY